MFARTLGQMLYDMPPLFSGYASSEMVRHKLASISTGKAVRICKDHHHSRQKGGQALIDLIRTSALSERVPAYDTVCQIVDTYRQVHYVTATENNRLRFHQQLCSSEAAYRRAGVILHDARLLFSNIGRPSKAFVSEMYALYAHLYATPTLFNPEHITLPQYVR